MTRNRSISLRAGIAALTVASIITVAIDGPRIGALLALAGITGANWMQSSIYCRADEPSIYLGGVLMAGCPNKTRR